MTNNLRVGVYPGTFDPVTNGHVDIIRRAARTVDTLIVGVAINGGKGPLFSLDERTAMVNEEIISFFNIFIFSPLIIFMAYSNINRKKM